MVDLEKPEKPKGMIALASVLERSGTGSVGVAKIERTRGNNLIFHIDASEMPQGILRRGFSFGKPVVSEET